MQYFAGGGLMCIGPGRF